VGETPSGAQTNISNSVTIPAGTIVSIPASTIHTEEKFYPNPNQFDRFHFEKLRKTEQDTTSKYQLVTMSDEYLPFGVGNSGGRYSARCS
jgi:cytochrome P450